MDGKRGDDGERTRVEYLKFGGGEDEGSPIIRDIHDCTVSSGTLKKKERRGERGREGKRKGGRGERVSRR